TPEISSGVLYARQIGNWVDARHCRGLPRQLGGMHGDTFIEIGIKFHARTPSFHARSRVIALTAAWRLPASAPRTSPVRTSHRPRVGGCARWNFSTAALVKGP